MMLSNIAFTRVGRGADLRVLRNDRSPPVLRGRGRAVENFADENLMFPRLLVKEGEEEEERVDEEYILSVEVVWNQEKDVYINVHVLSLSLDLLK